MDIKDKEVVGLLAELNAGKSLAPGREAQVWNDAHDRAISLVKGYREGKGLFQDPPAKGATP